MGFGVWGLRFRVWVWGLGGGGGGCGLGYRVLFLGVRMMGFGFRVEDSMMGFGFRVEDGGLPGLLNC